MNRIHFVFLLGILCSLLPYSVASQEAGQQGENADVKAAYISHFINFITWKNETYDNTLCVFSSSNVSEAFSRLSRQRNLNISLHYLGINSDLNKCRFIYFSPFETSNVQKILHHNQQKSLVTISDLHGFSKMGGDIELMIKDNKVLFTVNLRRHVNTNIHFSSQFLQAADNVIK